MWKFSLRHFSSPTAQSQFGTYIREIIDFLCVFLVCYTYICIYVFTYVYTYIELLKICQAFTILKSLRRTLCICATLAGARDWQPQIFHEPRLGPEAKRPWTLSGRLCTGPGFGAGRLQQDLAEKILRGVKHGITWTGTEPAWGPTSSCSRGVCNKTKNFKVRLNWSKNSNWENVKIIASVEPLEVTDQEFLQCYLIQASNLHCLRQAPCKLNCNT